MKKIRIVLLVMLTAVILSACNNDDDETQVESVQAVETVKVELGDLVVEKSLYGRIAPSSITPVLLQMPGEVESIEVENGDQVKEDDVVAKVKTPAGIQNIKASKDGEIMQLDVQEGDLVTEENPLALIVDLDKMKINFTVTHHIRSLFKKDATLTALINDEEFDVNISSIGKMPDETGLYPIEATVKNKDGHILPGMTALITVPEERIKESIILPTEAIVEDSEGTFIYVVKDDKVIKTEIEIKATQSDRSAIEAEISEGDQVVVNGQLTLSDGSKVNIVKAGNES